MKWHRIVMALVPFALGGCMEKSTAVQRGIRDQILHRGNGVEVADLDPQLDTHTNEANVLYALFEGLVSEDPVDLHPVPGVAESWDISPDGLTYTFHLRDSLWSDGSKLVADDFIRSYRRMLTPSLAADNSSLFYSVHNAEAFNKGHITDFTQVGFSAPTSRTLVITLERPVSYFLSLLTHWCWFPVPIATIEKYGPAYDRSTPWTRPGRLVGNGPFVLTEWKPHDIIIVKKSSTYWDADKVRLKEIYFHPVDSLDSEERSFRAGQIHMTESLPIDKIDTYRTQHPDQLRMDPYSGVYFYRFNVNRPVLNDRRIRRALSLSIDRFRIAAKILRGSQTPAFSMVPPNTAGYTSTTTIKGSVDEAKRLLKEAGYPDGKGLPVLEIAFNSSENHKLIAEAIQEMWRRELNIETQLVNLENKVLSANRRTGDFQILRGSWISDYDDPSSFLGVWTSDSGNNYTGWKSHDYDQLMARAANTSETRARQLLYQKAETVLLEESPAMPIYYYNHVFLIHSSVKGWHPTLLDHHPYKYVWLEQN